MNTKILTLSYRPRRRRARQQRLAEAGAARDHSRRPRHRTARRRCPCAVQTPIAKVMYLTRTAADPAIVYYKVDLTSAEAIKEVAEKVEREVGHP